MDMERELELLLRKRKVGACKECGSEMKSNKMGRYLCPNCGNIQLDEEGRVREYLREHGTASYAEVQSVTGASREVLDKFLSTRFQ